MYIYIPLIKRNDNRILPTRCHCQHLPLSRTDEDKRTITSNNNGPSQTPISWRRSVRTNYWTRARDRVLGTSNGTYKTQISTNLIQSAAPLTGGDLIPTGPPTSLCLSCLFTLSDEGSGGIDCHRCSCFCLAFLASTIYKYLPISFLTKEIAATLFVTPEHHHRGQSMITVTF